MEQIVRALEGDVSLDDLNEGVRPGQSARFNSNESNEYDINSYNSDMEKFRKMALATQGFESSEGNTHRSDHEHNNSASANDNSREMKPNNNQRLGFQL